MTRSGHSTLLPQKNIHFPQPQQKVVDNREKVRGRRNHGSKDAKCLLSNVWQTPKGKGEWKYAVRDKGERDLIVLNV